MPLIFMESKKSCRGGKVSITAWYTQRYAFQRCNLESSVLMAYLKNLTLLLFLIAVTYYSFSSSFLFSPAHSSLTYCLRSWSCNNFFCICNLLWEKYLYRAEMTQRKVCNLICNNNNHLIIRNGSAVSFPFTWHKQQIWTMWYVDHYHW